LDEIDGNAVIIFRKVRKELIKYLTEEQGWSREEAVKEGDAFQAEAISGDYEDMLATCRRWVDVI
jgi:hypothetical protein